MDKSSACAMMNFYPVQKMRGSIVATNRQGLREIRERMQELYVYDLYGFRTEIKPLASVLYPLETINCFAMGIHEGKRKLIVVTYYRIIIVSTSFGSPAQITEIPREAVGEPSYKKRFFTSSISFTADGKVHTFSLVSRRVLELFVWAVQLPAPIRS